MNQLETYKMSEILQVKEVLKDFSKEQLEDIIVDIATTMLINLHVKIHADRIIQIIKDTLTFKLSHP